MPQVNPVRPPSEVGVQTHVDGVDFVAPGPISDRDRGQITRSKKALGINWFLQRKLNERSTGLRQRTRLFNNNILNYNQIYERLAIILSYIMFRFNDLLQCYLKIFTVPKMYPFYTKVFLTRKSILS